MTNPNYKKWKEILITVSIHSLILILIIAITIIAIAIIAIANFNKIEDAEITRLNCSNNNTYTDTYYTKKDNKCHLSLCENSIFVISEDCIYEGLGINKSSLNYT